MFLVLISCLAVLGLAVDPCKKFRSCVSCTNTSHFESLNTACRWCSNSCELFSPSSPSSFSSCVQFDDTCPVSAAEDNSRSSASLLSSWMGSLPMLNSLSLLDLSLPGTHDSLTYDLSTTVSEGGIDSHDELSHILHEYETLPFINDCIRQQAQCQDLDITQQLSNGVRFIDFRLMLEFSDEAEDRDWFSLHCVQSNQKALDYFSKIHDWITEEEHNKEIIVIWISKHGSTSHTGNDAYPNVTVAEKQSFWNSITSLFSDVIADVSVSPLHLTSLQTLQERNHRVVFYVSDYAEFTNYSSLALDANLIDNQLGPGSIEEAYSWELSSYATAQETINKDKVNQGFYLMSLSPSIPSQSTFGSIELRYFPYSEKVVEACAQSFNIPGFTSNWCPQTLLDISQLGNYYKQKTMEIASSTKGYRFPNAIYLNGLDVDGTIRTGTRVLWGADRSFDSNFNQYHTASYAYADTLILSNVQIACEKLSEGGSMQSKECEDAISMIQQRRALHPLTLWDEPLMGRVTGWPESEVSSK